MLVYADTESGVLVLWTVKWAL